MLQIDSVSKLYKGGDKALDNISFSVEQGELIKPTRGRIIINNQDFTKLKGRKKRDIQKTIGTIYQDFCLVDTITCLDNVLNGALADRNAFQALFGIFTKEQKEYARKQLDILADGIVSDSIATIRDMESGARNEEIDSIEVVFYKGSCDNIYVKTREYYENYKKRQALR